MTGKELIKAIMDGHFEDCEVYISDQSDDLYKAKKVMNKDVKGNEIPGIIYIGKKETEMSIRCFYSLIKEKYYAISFESATDFYKNNEEVYVITSDFRITNIKEIHNINLLNQPYYKNNAIFCILNDNSETKIAVFKKEIIPFYKGKETLTITVPSMWLRVEHLHLNASEFKSWVETSANDPVQTIGIYRIAKEKNMLLDIN